MRPSALLAAAAVLLLADDAEAHMEMKSPPPRRSKWNPHEDYTTIDYSNTAPLAADGSNFPCKNYPSKGNVAVLKAGEPLRVELTGGAPHGGGHCQFAISYDGGKSFGVLKTIIRNCMAGGEGLTPTVPISAELPACSSCIFAWTWINAIGNREYYMNCADVEIKSSASGPVTLPALTIANLPGYRTVPEFPNPGDPDCADVFNHDRTVSIGSSTNNADGGIATAAVKLSSQDAKLNDRTSAAGESSQPVAVKAKTAATTKKKVKSAKKTSKSAAKVKAKTTPANVGKAAASTAASTTASPAAACTPGEMRCSEIGFQFCVPTGDTWEFGATQSCAPGTHCVSSGKQIICAA